MEWLYFALISGSLLTSLHPTEEACLGRKAIMEKENKSIYLGRCVRVHESSSGGSSSAETPSITYIPNVLQR